MIIAHLSDPHIDDTPAARAKAAAVVAHVAACDPAPDLVLVTGDITEDGTASQYAQARAVFAPLDPLYLAGNHDDAARLARELAAPGPAEHHHRFSVRGEVGVALLDTTVPGAAHGRCDAADAAWLGEVVGHPGPLVVAMHHPPVAVGSPVLDPIGLREPGELAAVLATRTGPTLLLAGHAHTAAATRFAGHPLRLAPGIAGTLLLPWEPGGTFDHTLPPGLAWHLFPGPDGAEPVTHVRLLPYPVG